MKTTSLKLLTATLVLAGFAVKVSAQPVAHTAQDFQNDLTTAESDGADNTIYLTNDLNGGYFVGNFNYNSTGGHSLVIQPAPGTTGTISIDGGGGGRDLNITCSSSSGNVTVNNITFIRNCGNYLIGALRIAAGSGGTINVSGCNFLSPTADAGEGLEIVAGQNATIINCQFIGKTNNFGPSAYDGDGLYLAGINGNTLLYNCILTGNNQGYGAEITDSAVLIVTNDIFQTNFNGGLHFASTNGNQLAFVQVTNNVFISNHGDGADFNNLNTLDLVGNIFSFNSGSYAVDDTSVNAAIIGNTFTGNVGGVGGASFNFTTGSLAGNTFSGNSGYYGGVYLYASKAEVTNNTFTGNTSIGGNYGGGGGYFSGTGSGDLVISNNIFSGNTTVDAPGGGALVEDSIAAGGVVVAANTFIGNSCGGNFGGGALYVSDSCTNLITGNTFENNSASDGGGAIYAVTAGNTILSDNLVISNTQSSATATGGGIYVNPATNFYMVQNTVFGNTSGGGGGGASFIVSGLTQLLYVFNNIFYGNTSIGNGPDVYLAGTGLQTAFECNDVGNPNDMNSVWSITMDLVTSDPLFFDPINGDYHLTSASLCKAAGTNTVTASLPAIAIAALPSTDLDGDPLNNLPDLGCYQINTTVPHPADLPLPASFAISLTQYENYSNAWKFGLPWTVAPNPIPANYLTRAGYLLQSESGEPYYYNDGSSRPTNWKPSDNPNNTPP